MHNSFFEEISDIFPLYYKVCTFQITAFLFTFFSEKRIIPFSTVRRREKGDKPRRYAICRPL